MDYRDQWNQNRVEWLYQLARCKEVGPAAVRVGLLFATFLQPEEREEVKPGYDWLTANAHMSRTTLAKALRELDNAGFIHVEAMRRYRSHYSMTITGDERWQRVPKHLSPENGPY